MPLQILDVYLAVAFIKVAYKLAFPGWSYTHLWIFFPFHTMHCLTVAVIQFCKLEINIIVHVGHPEE